MAMTVLAFAVAVGSFWLAWRCVVEIRVARRRRASAKSANRYEDGRIFGSPGDSPGESVTESADEELVELLQQYVLGEEQHAGPAHEPNILALAVVFAVLVVSALTFIAGAIYQLVG